MVLLHTGNLQITKNFDPYQLGWDKVCVCAHLNSSRILEEYHLYHKELIGKAFGGTVKLYV